MNDYFLLDPDYKNFDFTDKEKLKFVTVYGEQYGNIIAAMCLLIGCGTFLLVTLAAIGRDLDRGRNVERTVGTVIQGCDSLSNWYVYSFEAEDQSGILRQFTGRTYADIDIPCREVGNSIRVEYLRYDLDSAHETTGESSSSTSIYVYIFVLIFDFYGLHLAIQDIRAIQQARSKYDRLKDRSIIIGGQISHVDEANNLLRPHLYLIEVEYEFWSDRQILRGMQIKRRNDLKGKPLPQPGTPVRILYADDSTYVML